MPYLQELMTRFISYKNSIAIMWIIISLIILGIGVFSLIKLNKWRKSDEYDEYDDDIIYAFLMVGISILVFIFFIVLICNIEGLFQNIFIPELTVVDYIKNINIIK